MLLIHSLNQQKKMKGIEICSRTIANFTQHNKMHQPFVFIIKIPLAIISHVLAIAACCALLLLLEL